MSVPKINDSTHSELANRLDELDRKISHSNEERIDMLEKLAAHSVKIEENSKDINELDRDISKLIPKPLDWVKLTAIIVSIGGALVSGAYFINAKLEDRPTQSQVEKLVDPNTKDIKEIKDEQIQQRRILDKMNYSLDGIVDTIKDLKNDIKTIKGRR